MCLRVAHVVGPLGAAGSVSRQALHLSRAPSAGRAPPGSAFSGDSFSFSVSVSGFKGSQLSPEPLDVAGAVPGQLRVSHAASYAWWGGKTLAGRGHSGAWGPGPEEKLRKETADAGGGARTFSQTCSRNGPDAPFAPRTSQVPVWEAEAGVGFSLAEARMGSRPLSGRSYEQPYSPSSLSPSKQPGSFRGTRGGRSTPVGSEEDLLFTTSRSAPGWGQGRLCNHS